MKGAEMCMFAKLAAAQTYCPQSFRGVEATPWFQEIKRRTQTGIL
jgi:hypothetical protein